MVTRRIILRTALALAVTVAGVLGYLDVHGDFQRWSDNSALDGACDGLLDRDVVRGVLGSGEVEVHDRGDGDLVAKCQVDVDGGGSAEVSVLDTASVAGSRDSLYRANLSDVVSVPVGHGWSGLFGADMEDPKDSFDSPTEHATTSLVLDCVESSQVDGLSVTVRTKLRDATLDNPANRPQYARIATSTAARVSEKLGCGAKIGKDVRRLGLPVSEDEYEPLRTAGGTCSGIPTARGVSVATETDRGGAPYEICRLADADVSTRYILSARFGPYAQEAYADYQERSYGEGMPSPDIPSQQRDADGPVSWSTAKCPDGVALFTLQAAGDRGVDRKDTAESPGFAYERAALGAFAERSAEAHRCSAPAAL
ncbi:hypothetical protein [Streptomyces sp. NPDC005374]|uniref:hypothetical protein n=1 Tax=Streptomyces sp. NPDC005374 TaxID=3364713 RepID=UPI0036C3FC94